MSEGDFDQKNIPPVISRQSKIGRKISSRNQRKCYRDLKKLTAQNEKQKTKINTLHHTISRLRNKISKRNESKDQIKLSVDHLLKDPVGNRKTIRQHLVRVHFANFQ